MYNELIKNIFKNKNGINNLKSMINKIIDERICEIVITDTKKEIPNILLKGKDIVITVLAK
mgnify:FL=1